MIETKEVMWLTNGNRGRFFNKVEFDGIAVRRWKFFSSIDYRIERTFCDGSVTIAVDVICGGHSLKSRCDALNRVRQAIEYVKLHTSSVPSVMIIATASVRTDFEIDDNGKHHIRMTINGNMLF
jgi:hypothetical protein